MKSINGKLITGLFVIGLIVSFSPTVVEAQTTGGSCITFSIPALRPGDSGINVQKLQQFLIAQGFSIPAGATGYFGNQTKSAVASFMQANGIQNYGGSATYGFADQRVLTKITELSCGSGTNPNPNPNPSHAPPPTPPRASLPSP